ncbi:TrbC/VirB2 family protein [Rickettsia endosymbiont of Cantharis rufa]|uniref:TrbC/VirB2 family protein n=1 Tax=Rickettsia endosymbiont of Cantharis rufa TaxID=3066248 RepID=UPI003132F7D5
MKKGYSIHYKIIFCAICHLTSCVALADVHYDNDPIGVTLCLLSFYMRPKITRAIAVIAIIVFGIQALRGKISWQVSMMIMVGILIITRTDNIMRFLDATGVIDLGPNKYVCDADK